MVDVSSFLKTGWENMWKNKSLWGFSFLILLEPIVRIFIPYQTNSDLFTSLLNIAISFGSVYLSILSIVGVAFISYRVANGEAVSLEVAYQASKHVFWRVIGLILALFLFLSPFTCAVFIYSFKYPAQVINFARNFLFFSFPLSAFAAIFYFSLAEIVINGSKIRESLKSAWTIFSRHFAVLIFIGLILAIISFLISAVFGAGLMIAKNNLDISSLKQFDFLSPNLSFQGNNFYTLASTVITIFLRTYSTSVFMFAYLKYNGVIK